MTTNGASNTGTFRYQGVVAESEDRSHHDCDKEHGDVRLQIAEANGIAITGDQVAQLGLAVLAISGSWRAANGSWHGAFVQRYHTYIRMNIVKTMLTIETRKLI